MKVLHLISGGDTGGARTHVHLLLKYLNRDMEADMVCFMQGPFAEDAAAMGIPVTVMEKNPLSALPRLCRMVREGGYTLIHCHGSRGNLMGALLKPFVSVPVISTVHSDPRLDYMGRPAARLTYGSLNAAALRRMDHYVGVSDAMRQMLIDRGFPGGHIHTIYNGVEFPAPPAAEGFNKWDYLRGLGLNCGEGNLVVGIAARLHPVKDIPTLLRGFQKAYSTHRSLRLVIAGDGQELDSLRALAAELGVADTVCFAGWINGMTEFYKALDINTLTSLSETFPYAITEGARESLPTVASRVGGVPKLILHDQTGLLFEAGDWETLGTHLSALADSAELRQRLGAGLYDKANREFSAAATAKRQQEIYRAVLREYGKDRDGVLICGAYGMHNLGDDAVLHAIVEEMRSIDPTMPVRVLSRRPRETSAENGVAATHMFNVFGFHRAMKRSKLYINGGGSLIQDVTSSRSLWYYLYTIAAAKRRGCRVMMYGCGIGPVNKSFDRRLACRVIDGNVDAITLRGERSMEELKAFGVTRPELVAAADPALFLPDASDVEIDAALRGMGLEPRGNYFGISLRRWPGMEQKVPMFAAAADYAYEKYGLRPVLLSVNYQQDRKVMAMLREQIKAPCAVAQEPIPVNTMVGVIGRMRAVMAMRLHVLIFAAARAVPVAAVSYDPKVASFLEDLNEFNVLEDSALESPEQLYHMVDVIASADRTALAQATKRIMEKECRNVETARRLLEPEAEL